MRHKSHISSNKTRAQRVNWAGLNNMKTTKPQSRKIKNYGMNWCRPATRLAIYMRDGMACAYCGHSVEDGAQLTLDHLKPYSKGGDNKPTNLVTCCSRCNSSRGNRSVTSFAKSVAEYINHGATAEEILKHVRNTARRVLPRKEANELVNRRGSVSRVLKNHK